MKITPVIIALVLSAATLSVPAQDFSVGELVVRSPWARPLPAVSENGAAYLTIVNHAMSPDRLISASSPIAERVELHTNEKNGPMMVMRKLQAVEVGAHDTVSMRPGGMHMMLLGLKRPLVAGETFPLALTFAKAGEVTITVPIELRATAADAPAMKHGMYKN